MDLNTRSRWRRHFWIGQRTRFTVKRMAVWRLRFFWGPWISLWVGVWRLELWHMKRGGGHDAG